MHVARKWVGFSFLALMVAVAAAVGVAAGLTERRITALADRVAAIGAAAPAPAYDAARAAALPEPVQRYFRFVFKGMPARYAVVRLSAKGDFRRPRTERFSPTTAEQVIAAGVPALMFSATTPLVPGVWARAYDYFAEGEMEMKAKVVSTLTVVDERSSPALNATSLRRWLLESALYPAALLPGGPVTWEAVDPDRARAVVAWRGSTAKMVASFDAEGRMTQMAAEGDGDLSTPYHGSGELVTRSNYREVRGQMVPMDFVVSRRAGGRVLPFWKGSITSIAYE